MSRIWSMMDVGRGSMSNSQTALQTVSHNVANRNTEGYSRQRVEQVTNNPIGEGKLRMGMGAKSAAVTRTNNPFIEKQVEKEGNLLGSRDSKAQSMARVEQVFNEQMNKGLNKFMGDFFNAYREMSNSPENSSLRTMVKESADFLAKDFNRIHNQLTKIQSEADFQIQSDVNTINGFAKEVAQLNEKIKTVEVTGGTANDERDRRDLLLKKMSEKVDIRYGESTDGILSVNVGNVVIIAGSTQRDLIAAPTEGRPGKREGNVDILYRSNDYSNSKLINVTEQIKSGSLGGLLEVRDKFVNETLDSMNELAGSFADEINKAHMAGFDRYDQEGQELFSFDEGDAAAKIHVNDAIMEDSGLVVAAAQKGSPGDNRVANVISSLQYQQKLNGGQSTFDDFYNNVVGRVGISTGRANSELESQKDVVTQLKNIRESVSGVSLDEETTKMIEYQKSFDASARLIKTADQMMETVLQLKQM